MRILLAAAVSLGLSSCAAPSGEGTASRGNDGAAAIEQQVHLQTNAYRQSKGAQVLRRHRVLDDLARQHCDYLRRNRGSFSLYGANVSHVGSDGRMAAANHALGIQHLMEIVAVTPPAKDPAVSARHLVSLWKGSDRHDPVMRAGPWTHCGVGAVVDADGTVFCTQLFCTVGDFQMRPSERFNRF